MAKLSRIGWMADGLVGWMKGGGLICWLVGWLVMVVGSLVARWMEGERVGYSRWVGWFVSLGGWRVDGIA